MNSTIIHKDVIEASCVSAMVAMFITVLAFADARWDMMVFGLTVLLWDAKIAYREYHPKSVQSDGVAAHF